VVVEARGKLGGKNMAYVLGPLQIAAGAAGEYFAPGNPISTSLIGGGIGETAGKAAGGSGAMGELLGGLGGGIGGSAMGLGGPFSSMIGPGTSTGEGLRGMLGMPQSGTQTMEDIASGKIGAGPGGIDPLLKQSVQDLQAWEGAPGAQFSPPTYQGQSPSTSGLTPVGGAGSGISDLLKSPAAGPALSAASNIVGGGGGGTSTTSAQSTPAFKGPLAQSPVAPKGQAPTTAITPTVTKVPQRQYSGRTTQDNYRKLLQEFSSGNTGMG
jgi:hypothetical protein